MQRIQEWKLVMFDGRFQSYFTDGSTILWENGSILYYSTKGNKVKIGVQTLKFSQDILNKIYTITSKLNSLQDEYYTPTLIDPQQTPLKTADSYFKKYKIDEFYWQNAEVKEVQQGFITKSDDGTVQVILLKDLYKIKIQYPQRTGRRQVSEQGRFLVAKNRRKQLIQKYGGQYVQYPQSMVQVDIEYEYVQITKQFTMFGLPKRWCPPLRIIWGYLLANKTISHPFCYIDFQDPDNKILRDVTTTKMPPVVPLLTIDNEQVSLSQTAIPLYSKPNHAYKWKWLYVQREQMQIFAYYIEGGGCIICQNYGFWFIEESYAIYRILNKDEVDYKVALSAFPFMVRMQKQPARDIRLHIMAASAYKDHRQYINNRPKEQISNHFQVQDQICQEQIPHIGIFKAYGNGVVVARFQDKTLMTIRKQQIKIIAPNGRSLLATLGGAKPKEFVEHLNYLSDWYEKIYMNEQWNDRIALNEALQQNLRETEAFITVAKHYQRK